jgi:hypothetical protein
VVDQAVEPVGLTCVDGHLQRINDQVASQRRRHLAADDEPAEDVDHEGHVDKADMGLHIGEVGHPQTIGSVGHALAVHEVDRAVQGVVGDAGDRGYRRTWRCSSRSGHVVFDHVTDSRAALVRAVPSGVGRRLEFAQLARDR